MVPLTDPEIYKFRVHGNYANNRSLQAGAASRLGEGKQILPGRPGYSPPIVEFELQSGATGKVVIREIDLPMLSQEDREKARKHLRLILSARRGDQKAHQDLSAVVREQLVSSRGNSVKLQPAASRFVVPCSSGANHTEQDISHKGSILLKLSQRGYPVPDFVILTAHAYADGETRREDHLAEAIQQLEILTSQSFGEAPNPLVFAIRCCMPHYMPGLMQTYLNVGVTEGALPCLEKIYGSVAARKMFLNNLRNLCISLDCADCSSLASSVRADLGPEEVTHLVEQLSGLVRQADRKLLEDPLHQAAFLVRQAYEHFEDVQDLLLTLSRGKDYYPSLILQKMICTVRHDDSYVGVMSSRHSQSGVGVELQTAHNIFGEEIMTGTRDIDATTFQDREVIRSQFPAIYHFAPHLAALEAEFESPVTIEFAVEATERYQWFALLQLNETGMSGQAAILSAVEMHQSGTISRKRVSELIRPYHIKQLTSDSIDPATYNILTHFSSGVAVLPRSAVSARIYFTEDAALGAKKQGEKVCFCKKTFVPTDTVVMNEVDAIISLTSAAIHVVTICQSLGIPALLSLEKQGVSFGPGGGLVNSSGTEIQQGDWVTISSFRKSLYKGKAKFRPARLLRYMSGEPVTLDEEEQDKFSSIAYAYRYYRQLIRGLNREHISTLNEVINLVNLELRGETAEAEKLVNRWFDDRESFYVEEIFKSEVGDHLNQSRVFEMLSLDRKIRFFRRALAKCLREQICGYEAGAFMLGRFLASRYPVAFWKCFSPAETALLVNEWVLFEKYMQLLHNVGERKIIETRKKILKDGLGDLHLHPGSVKCLMPLKLSGTRLEESRACLPAWSDPQSVKVLELLQQPYRAFYDFNESWSVGELQRICGEENLPVPGPEEA